MFELLIVVFLGGITFLYKRKRFKNNQSQTEMVVFNKSTQTDSESEDSMSVDLSDMSFELDVDFFNRCVNGIE